MDRDAEPLLTLETVRFGFATKPDFLGPIDWSVRPGECWAIVGPNGAGKSTLLRLMAGLHTPFSGTVSFRDRPLAALSTRSRARSIAFLPQSPPADLDLTARSVVLLGRFPHRTMALFESATDYAEADRAMEISETLPFADRPMATLSGGEAQRVHLAAALAQQPELLLLDEPTASLDLKHQLGIYGILADRVAADRMGVVVVTHDVNLAARFATHALVLDDGRAVASGSPDEVITPEVLGPVYGVALEWLESPAERGRRWVVPAAVAREGENQWP